MRTARWLPCQRPTALLSGHALGRATGGPSTAALVFPSAHNSSHQKRHTSIHRVRQGEQLSFALITPKSLAKSLTGGIIARLLATPELQFVGARMLRPSAKLTDEFFLEMQRAAHEDGVIDPYEDTFLKAYPTIFGEEELKESGVANHTMLLLFAGGAQTRQVLADVVGANVPNPNDFGKTIRGTYGDYFKDRTGKINLFQPAVVVPPSDESNRRCLEVLAKYLDSDHALRTINAEERNQPLGWAKQTGLVMIKPDNLERPSSLPGHIIDLFGTTGLQLIGARVFCMSVRRGMEFYGFLENVFVKKLKPNLEEAMKQRLASAFEYEVTDQDYAKMADVVINRHARCEVAKIIHYMTGVHPDDAKTDELFRKPGPAKCFALLYRGDNAIEIIRSKLGVTDPKKARAGTIRSDYGHDLMRNGAHASDSPEGALRERRIVGLMGDEPSEEKAVILEWLHASSAPLSRQ